MQRTTSIGSLKVTYLQKEIKSINGVKYHELHKSPVLAVLATKAVLIK